jgi:hypothetical protein
MPFARPVAGNYAGQMGASCNRSLASGYDHSFRELIAVLLLISLLSAFSGRSLDLSSFALVSSFCTVAKELPTFSAAARTSFSDMHNALLQYFNSVASCVWILLRSGVTFFVRLASPSFCG